MSDGSRSRDENLPPTIAEGGGRSGSGSGGSSRPNTGSPTGRTFHTAETILGRYRIVRFLAEGGMGEVWEARDTELDSPVALKTIRPRLLDRPEAVNRFRREIQLARKVTHRNVCRIFDLVRVRRLEDGQLVDPATLSHPDRGEEILFLTMELLQGHTLAQRIVAEGPLTVEEARPIVRQMIDALEAAHEAGVVHRDFKSANVMLEPGEDGPPRVVVTDFGVARSMSAEEIEASLTATGLFVGTPSYMAPEQVEGKEVGVATDIYSLGCVLYEMFTGAVPFDGTTPLAVAVSRLTTPPPKPRRLAPDLDPRWERVILRCLERQPGDRFATAAEVRRALDGGWLRLSRRSRSRIGWTAAILVALASVTWVWIEASSRGIAVIDPPGVEAPATPGVRQSVAVVGFRNLAGRDDADWLSPALGQMIGMELAVGEGLRVIPEEAVSRMRHELGIGDDPVLERAELASIRTNLGSDLIVTGEFLAHGDGPDGQLRIDLRLADARTGETMVALSERGAESDLLELVAGLGADLRGRLGTDRPESFGRGVQASLPDDREAARLYGQGLERLESFDPRSARELLELARNLEPDFPLVHSALARAYQELGLEESHREAAARAHQLSDRLPREERYLAEARSHEANGRWTEAASVYDRLFGFYPDSPEYGLRLGESLVLGGDLEGAESVLRQLRESTASGSVPDPRIDLLEVDVADARGDYERMLAASQAATRHARERGAPLLVAEARSFEAWGQVFLGHPRLAQPAAEEARSIYSELGDRVGLADALSSLAPIHSMQGRHDQAAALSLEAASIHEEIGNRTAQIQALQNVTYDRLTQGDAAGAESSLREMEQLAEGLDLSVVTANQIDYLRAWLWTLQGRERDALALHRDLLARFEELGDSRRIAQAHHRIGEVLLSLGRVEEAREAFLRSVEIPEELGVAWYAAQNRVALAEAELLLGNVDQALEVGRAAVEALDRYDAFDRAAAARSTVARALARRGGVDEARSVLQPALEKWAELDTLTAVLAVATAELELEGGSSEAATGRLGEVARRARDLRNAYVARALEGAEAPAVTSPP